MQRSPLIGVRVVDVGRVRGSVPIARAEPPAHDLVRRGAGESLHDLDVVDLEEGIQVGSDRLLEVPSQGVRVDLSIEHHEDHEPLCPSPGVRYPYSGALVHRRVVVHHSLELDGADLDAPEVHGVVGPTEGPVAAPG